MAIACIACFAATPANIKPPVIKGLPLPLNALVAAVTSAATTGISCTKEAPNFLAPSTNPEPSSK